MLRKHIVKTPPRLPVSQPGERDIAATAPVQVEEPEVSRAQKLWLSVSHDGGQICGELRCQKYHQRPAQRRLSANRMKGKI